MSKCLDAVDNYLQALLWSSNAVVATSESHVISHIALLDFQPFTEFPKIQRPMSRDTKHPPVYRSD